MVVLVDEARWPAHGRHWAHLVSDTSLEELHAFARAAGLPPRGFDHDHYDVPDTQVPQLVAAGAQPVGSRELLRRLVASGLRVPARDRTPGGGHPAPRGVVGVLLAAGAGTRFGGPKALARSADGTPWLVDRVAALRSGGCGVVLVVLGAAADDARRLLPEGAVPVMAHQWQRGMSASLQEGLRAAARLDPAPAAALVALVDVPGLTAQAVRRLTRLAGPRPGGPGRDGGAAPSPHDAAVLARASYDGRAGHPVLLGRRHWAAAAADATGDRGAGRYLRAAGALLVECGDVADGADVDAPATPGTRRPAPTLSG